MKNRLLKSVVGRQLKECVPPAINTLSIEKKKKKVILELPESALFPVMDKKYTLIFLVYYNLYVLY